MLLPDLAGGVESFAYELTNDGGSWVGDGSGFGSGDVGGGSVTLSGRDGHEGLTAFVVHGSTDAVDAWGLEALIFSGEMPEVPEPYAAE